MIIAKDKSGQDINLLPFPYPPITNATLEIKKMNELMISDTGILARAELDTQITTAKAYPRNQIKFVESAIELATLDQETAESCFYCLVRNGKDGKSEIKGPSIRLAEIAASCWGNIHAATRIVENNGKFITAQGVAWDLEKNVKMSAEVKRKITTKDGRTYSEDMQGVTGNAAAAIALRNAILKVVPRALIDRVYEAAVKFAVGDQKKIETKRKEIFDRFSKMGIETQRILSFYGKASIDEFDISDLGELIGIGTSIKDGLLKIDRAFSMEEVEDNSTEEKIKSLLGDK
jgi:hypothetical protein